MDRAHLAGSPFEPWGPRLTLTRSVATGDQYFFTEDDGEIHLGEAYTLVIDFGQPAAEIVRAECIGVEGSELKWRLVGD
jgi:hypothetical protein